MSFNQKNVDLFQSMLDQWHPWEEKFAWFPIVINGQFIWFRNYYERCKMFMPEHTKQRAVSIFDILKED